MNGLGQKFDDFLIQEGLFDEVKDLASKKIIAFELQEEMKKQHITKSKLSKLLNTSRTAVENILDPHYNTSLGSLERTATAIGKHLVISLQ